LQAADLLIGSMDVLQAEILRIQIIVFLNCTGYRYCKENDDNKLRFFIVSILISVYKEKGCLPCIPGSGQQ
jgi:hypothetical protein